MIGVVVGAAFWLGLTVGQQPPVGLDLAKAYNSGGLAMEKSSQTKVPYNNGFYVGPYNPALPAIDPTAK